MRTALVNAAAEYQGGQRADHRDERRGRGDLGHGEVGEAAVAIAPLVEANLVDRADRGDRDIDHVVLRPDGVGEAIVGPHLDDRHAYRRRA